MILSLRSAAPGATRLTLCNDGASTGYELLQGASFGAPTWQHTFSSPRGTQGARASQGSLPNREVQLPIRVTGATKDAMAASLRTLTTVVDDMRRFGGTCRMRSKSQTLFQNFDVLTSSVSMGEWSNRIEHRFVVVLGISLICGPYIEYDPMDVIDGFDTDNVNAGDANYTASAGALANVSVSGGVMAGAANLATENRLVYTGNGYALGDHEAFVSFVPGSTLTSFKAGVLLKWIDASNYLVAYVDDDGANSRRRIDKVVAGVTTNLASTVLAPRLVASVPGSVRARIEGNVVSVEFQSAELQFASAASPATVTLSTAEAAIFGIGTTGKSGIVFTPQHASAAIDRFGILPFTYRAQNIALTTGDVIHARGSIPGDAPAACDVWLAASASSTGDNFGLVGWAPQSNPNRLQNGGFEASATTQPWTVAAIAGVTGAATSIATAAPGKFGSTCGSVVAPATANVGASYPIYQRFTAGVTYTARVWVRSAAATTLARLRFGVSGDIQSSTAVALSTTWTLHTVTWTPTASVTLAYLAVEQTAATAGTWNIDGAAVYEGTTAPTFGRHIEGAGGYPPLAIIAGADYTTTDSPLSPATDASALSGWVHRDTSVAAGGETYEVTYTLSPGLIGADDYAGGDVTVEVWGRFYLHTAFTGGITFTLALTDYLGTQFTYTSEFGSAGKRISAPSTTGYKTVRLGSLPLSVASSPQARLRLLSAVAAGTNLQQFGIDCLYVMPVRSRASSPTGKSSSGYPSIFAVASATQTKIISGADLSGTQIGNPTDLTLSRGSGLAGSLIELPPGLVDFLAIINNAAVEDTSNTRDLATYVPKVHLAVTPRGYWLRDA